MNKAPFGYLSAMHESIQATFLHVKLFPVYLSWSFANAMSHIFNCIANTSLSPITQYAARLYKSFSLC